MTVSPNQFAPSVSPGSIANTHFTFAHKVFTVDGAIFRLNRITGVVSLHVAMGDLVASLDLQNLPKAFGIEPGSPDAQMLRQVERGLRFVEEIRPGDSIPTEILNGTASWVIEPYHFKIAHSRLLMQLANWMTEGSESTEDGPRMIALIEQPEIREKINEAFVEAANSLGLTGKKGKEQIIDMIAQLARELAYIEALREKIAGYIAIRRKVKKLAPLYHNDANTQEAIERIITLTNEPFAKIREQFQMLETKTAQIVATLRSLTATIHNVRDHRDRLRTMVLLWGDRDREWFDVPVERSTSAEQAIVATYRFIAAHYMDAQRWSLQNAIL